jgi:hypothetical protein
MHPLMMAIDPTASGREGHAAHRPPGPPPTSFGNLYPRGDIVVVVQDRESAQALLKALGEASFPETDLDILEPEMVVAAADKLRRSRTLLGRIGSLLGDEGDLADRSLELARAGHPVVLVHAPSNQEVDRARPVLASQRVLLAAHYGALTITDL